MIIDGQLERPSFRDQCPCCDRPECAEFHGYYRRGVVTAEGLRIADFPVLRYICRAPRLKPGQHRTFSLLPAQLIPYRRPSQDFLVAAMKTFLASRQTVAQRLDMICEQFPEGSVCENIGTSHLWDFSRLLLETTQKMSLWKQRSFPELRQAVDFIANYPGGAVTLSMDYYQAHGGWQGKSPFLFGTPSQFRSMVRPP